MNKSSFIKFILVLVILYFIISSIFNSLEYPLEIKRSSNRKSIFIIITLSFLFMVIVNMVTKNKVFNKKNQINQLLKSVNNSKKSVDSNRNRTSTINNDNSNSNIKNTIYNNRRNNNNNSSSNFNLIKNNNLKLVNKFNQKIEGYSLSIPIINIDQLVFSDYNLGIGSYGAVKKAKFMGKEVAIKTGWKCEEMAANEIKCHVLLSGHKNILEIEGCFKNVISGGPSVVLELMDMSLHEYLMSNKDSLWDQRSSIYRIVREIINGLKYMHFNSFVHGDLHPGNILMKKNSPGESCPTHVKLCDFGLSKYLPNDILSNTSTIGCSVFMSPETIAGGRAVYQKSDDIYSLAVMVWLMFNMVSYGSNCGDIYSRFKVYGVSELEFSSIPQIEGLIRKCLGPSDMRPSIEEFELEIRREEAKFNANERLVIYK